MILFFWLIIIIAKNFGGEGSWNERTNHVPVRADWNRREWSFDWHVSGKHQLVGDLAAELTGNDTGNWNDRGHPL